MNPAQPLSQIEGLTTLFQSPFSTGFFGYFIALIALSCLFYRQQNPLHARRVYWVMGGLLLLFTALRPMGLGIDDLGYIEISKGICAFADCFQVIQAPRDWAWYALISLLKSFAFVNGDRAVLLLAVLGLATQLYVIDRLCHQKLLALTLFTPLVYLLFDFTIFRAGLALSAYFWAFYLLVRQRPILGNILLLGNFVAHSQAIFSIGLWPFHWIAKFKKIAIAIIFIALLGIYLQITPNIQFLSIFIKGAAQTYVEQAKNGDFSGLKLFPALYILLLTYLSILLAFSKTLLNQSQLSKDVAQYVLASILLALVLAWFFAPIQVMQSRLLEFYFAPIVLISGNLERNRWAFIGTIVLAILIYARMELIHNFILG
jgi:hypothetical protein